MEGGLAGSGVTFARRDCQTKRRELQSALEFCGEHRMDRTSFDRPWSVLLDLYYRHHRDQEEFHLSVRHMGVLL